MYTLYAAISRLKSLGSDRFSVVWSIDPNISLCRLSFPCINMSLGGIVDAEVVVGAEVVAVGTEVGVGLGVDGLESVGLIIVAILVLVLVLVLRLLLVFVLGLLLVGFRELSHE